jgi:3-dehydroquinate synthetase
MQHDKKNVGSRIVFVLPVAPGKVKVFRDIDTKLVLKALDAARNEILNKYADI